MSGYGPYFADDEESSEDKISQLGSANTTGNDQTKTSEASTKDGFSGHQDDSKSNGTSAFSSSYHTNEDNTSYVSTTFSDPNDHSSQKQAVSSKSKRQGTQNESKFCTDSSEVSCDDLVIVLEESKFLKVLEDVVKELVEKLVTEKISGRSSVASQKQISGNQSSRSKPGNKTVDIKRSFDKKVKDLTESQKNNLEKPGAGPDLSKRAQHEHTVSDEKLTPQSSQQKSSKTPSESTQGKTVQPKTKVNKNKASGAKANSASSRERAAESSPIHDLNASDNQTCYFKSKSSAAKKTAKKERGTQYRDNTCKTICKTYMRSSPADLKEQNMKIANSLFSATFSLFMHKIKKQDALADKIGIALCGPRQCFEECSFQDQMLAGQFESPDFPKAAHKDDSNAENKGQLKNDYSSATKSGAVLPKLNSHRRSRPGSKKNIRRESEPSSICIKHCADGTANARSTPTVLPKL